MDDSKKTFDVVIQTSKLTADIFQNAIYDNNYQGFELDIRTTKDKKFVVVHDFFSDGNLISKTTIKT